jgi:hypothetical protein
VYTDLRTLVPLLSMLDISQSFIVAITREQASWFASDDSDPDADPHLNLSSPDVSWLNITSAEPMATLNSPVISAYKSALDALGRNKRRTRQARTHFRAHVRVRFSLLFSTVQKT